MINWIIITNNLVAPKIRGNSQSKGRGHYHKNLVEGWLKNLVIIKEIYWGKNPRFPGKQVREGFRHKKKSGHSFTSVIATFT